MNNDYISIQAIDAWGQKQVITMATYVLIPQAPTCIGDEPSDKLHEMRSWNRRNTVPVNTATIVGYLTSGILNLKVVHFLTVDVYYTAILSR